VKAAAAVLLALACPALDAAGSGRARIVEAADLSIELAREPPPLVLDARDRRSFEAGHVPGSLRVDWRDFSDVKPRGLNLLFGDSSRWGLLCNNREELRRRLRALGVAESRPIVVVGSPEGWGEEGRIAWMLLYLGARDVGLLDGGFPAWVRLKGAVVFSGEERAGPPGDFEPAPRPGRRIRREALRQAIAEGGLVLLDARTPAEFGGGTLAGQRRGGHLPGARLVPASALRTSAGSYVSAEELARLTGPFAPGAPIVTYCTGGVRSALLAVLLEARLGAVAANYDGSLWEWGGDDELPLETGTAGTPR